jgi:intracellular multiplication protein IcmE
MANIKGLNDSKTRAVLIATVAVLVVGVGAAIYSIHRGSDAITPTSQDVNAHAPASSGAPNTDTQSAEAYNKLLTQGNAQAAQDATANGTSAVPALHGATGATGNPSYPNLPVSIAPAPSTGTEQTTQNNGQPSAESLAQQRYATALADRQKEIANQKALMEKQIDLLQKSWGVAGHQSLEVIVENKDGAAGVAKASSTGGAADSAHADTPALVRAGDTAVAILDMPIDTDNPLPMYKAHIVQSGPLQDAVVLGTIQNNASTAKSYATGVNLTFTSAAVSGQPTLVINAVAINAEDAGALKGQVNNHLIERYAAAFGGSFLQAAGQGLLQGGRQQNLVTSTNGYAVQTDAFTNKQLVELGLGGVGQTAATSVQSLMNRPPTIKIPAGTTIALLFTADVRAVPTK